MQANGVRVSWVAHQHKLTNRSIRLKTMWPQERGHTLRSIRKPSYVNKWPECLWLCSGWIWWHTTFVLIQINRWVFVFLIYCMVRGGWGREEEKCFLRVIYYKIDAIIRAKHKNLVWVSENSNIQNRDCDRSPSVVGRSIVMLLGGAEYRNAIESVRLLKEIHQNVIVLLSTTTINNNKKMMN